MASVKERIVKLPSNIRERAAYMEYKTQWNFKIVGEKANSPGCVCADKACESRN